MSETEKVFHSEHGEGSLIQDLGDTVIARFRSGIQECRKADLEFRVTVQSAISSKEFHDANRTIARAQSIIIQTINQAWGSFLTVKDKVISSSAMGMSTNHSRLAHPLAHCR